MSVPERLDGHLQLLPPHSPVDGAKEPVAELLPHGELLPGDPPLVRLWKVQLILLSYDGQVHYGLFAPKTALSEPVHWLLYV